MCKRNWNDSVICLKEIYDQRGYILPFEFDDLPFTPRRFFYISNVPTGTIRGSHSHKKCKQIFICMGGKIIVNLCKKDNYTTHEMSYGNALYIPHMVWSSQEFYDGGIALVLASEKYEEDDYIRDYQEFRSMLGE